MAYNILSGGDQEAGDRTDALLEIISRADPDVVGLCECVGFADDGRRLQMFADRLGMEAAISAGGQAGLHVVILCKPHLRARTQVTNSRSMYCGLCVVSAQLPGSGPVALTMTHLHPWSSLFRLAEAQIVASRGLRPGEAVVMGDLNSLSPDDVPTASVGMPMRRRIRLTTPEGTLDDRPIRFFRSLGLVEVGPRSATYPTTLGGKLQRLGHSIRIDHVLATAGLAARVSRAEVPDDSLAHAASDHLPVVVDFDL